MDHLNNCFVGGPLPPTGLAANTLVPPPPFIKMLDMFLLKCQKTYSKRDSNKPKL